MAESPTRWLVSFFKRILIFSKDSAAKQGEQRNAKRYAVGPDFPLKTVINLPGRDADGNLTASEDGSGRDWSGRLLNLSEAGASMRLPPSALALRGETCRLKFILGESELEIPARIAHFRVHANHATCGVSLQFADAEMEGAYRQLLQPIIVGVSLAPVDPRRVKQDTPGFHLEQYEGEASVLSIWRAGTAEGAIRGFDIRMAGYGVRWSEGMTELETYGTGPGPEDVSTLSDAQQVEVRWLFCLAVPNLAKTVPADVRAFLAKLVA